MVEVNNAEYMGDYVINLSFNDGRSGQVNLEEPLFNDKRAAFAVLRDKSEFRKFKVEHSTLVWGEEFDYPGSAKLLLGTLSRRLNDCSPSEARRSSASTTPPPTRKSSPPPSP